MFKGHPKGLYVLFFTEMWERFSFYSMLALFVLYMSAPIEAGGLGWSRAEASMHYAWYTSLVYFTPFIGGLLADKWLGYTRAIMIGALFFCAGHILLAVPGMVTFYAALLCLIVGNGLFKPNISTLVGKLYPLDSPLRDSAFNIFYMGINAGALIAPIVAGMLAKYYGWHYGFGAAAVGMFISLIAFAAFKKHIIYADEEETEGQERREEVTPEVQRKRTTALFTIFGIAILFFMVFDQNGNVLAYWADNSTWWFSPEETKAEQPHPAITQSFNPFFVILLTFALVPFWAFLRKRGAEPSTPGKMLWGMLFAAASAGIMAVAALAGGDEGRVWVGWLVSGYFVITIGELCLSPMGLSLVTKLAPKKYMGFMMGMWFVATSIGAWLAGYLGVFWDEWKHSNFFFFLVGSSLFAALVLFLFLPFLKSAMPKSEHT